MSTAINYCCVKGCHYPSNHTTRGHKCGKCGLFGHGQTECGIKLKIDALKYASTYFPSQLHCTVPNCRGKYNHSTVSHHCSHCGDRHSESSCPNAVNQTSNAYAISEAKKIFGSTDGRIYATVYAGMGCDWYVRRDRVHGHISVFFMHTDSWGQYGSGPGQDDRQALTTFCNGYRLIK